MNTVLKEFRQSLEKPTYCSFLCSSKMAKMVALVPSGTSGRMRPWTDLGCRKEMRLHNFLGLRQKHTACQSPQLIPHLVQNVAELKVREPLHFNCSSCRADSPAQCACFNWGSGHA